MAAALGPGEGADAARFREVAARAAFAEAAGVTGTPTVHIFKEKARVEVMTGVKGKSEYKKVMAGHIGLEIDTTSKIGVSR